MRTCSTKLAYYQDDTGLSVRFCVGTIRRLSAKNN